MFDLLGEAVVTHDDLYAWVEAVAPAYTSSTRSFEHYVRGWSVADKVRRAKLDGTYETTIATRHTGFHNRPRTSLKVQINVYTINNADRI